MMERQEILARIAATYQNGNCFDRRGMETAFVSSAPFFELTCKVLRGKYSRATQLTVQYEFLALQPCMVFTSA